MGPPDGSAESGTEAYNYDYNNEYAQAEPHYENNEHYYASRESDFGPCDFDDSYYNDEDHTH